MKNTIQIFLSLSLFFIRESTAQQIIYPLDTSLTHTLHLQNGYSFTGKIIKEYPDSIAIKNDYFSRIVIQKKQIISIKNKSKFFPFENPNPHQYFLLPNAIPLRKGSVSYRNYYIGGHYINYGITKNISIGMGGTILPGFLIPIIYLFTISPKVEFSLPKKFYIGFGIVYYTHNMSRVSRDDGGSFRAKDLHDGGAYINVTYGTPDKNISLIYSYSTVSSGTIFLPYEEAAKEKQDLFNRSIKIGGMLRVHKNISLITENWIFYFKDDSRYPIFPIPAFGVRFFGKKLSGDFGMILMVPYFAMQYKFL